MTYVSGKRICNGGGGMREREAGAFKDPQEDQCGWNTMSEGHLAAHDISEGHSSQIMWGPVSLSRS